MCADVRTAHARYCSCLEEETRKRRQTNALTSVEFDRQQKAKKARFVERELAKKRKAAMLNLIAARKKQKKR